MHVLPGVSCSQFQYWAKIQSVVWFVRWMCLGCLHRECSWSTTVEAKRSDSAISPKVSQAVEHKNGGYNWSFKDSSRLETKQSFRGEKRYDNFSLIGHGLFKLTKKKKKHHKKRDRIWDNYIHWPRELELMNELISRHVIYSYTAVIVGSHKIPLPTA